MVATPEDAAETPLLCELDGMARNALKTQVSAMDTAAVPDRHIAPCAQCRPVKSTYVCAPCTGRFVRTREGKEEHDAGLCDACPLAAVGLRSPSHWFGWVARTRVLHVFRLPITATTLRSPNCMNSASRGAAGATAPSGYSRGIALILRRGSHAAFQSISRVAAVALRFRLALDRWT